MLTGRRRFVYRAKAASVSQPKEALVNRQNSGSAPTVWLVIVAVVVLLSIGAAPPRAAAPGAIATIAKRIAVTGKGNVVAIGGAVWATDDAGRLFRIDPGVNRVVARIPLATRSSQLCCAFGFGALWLADAASDTVIRIGVRENAVLARIPVGRSPVGTTVGSGSIWVANNGGASVMRIDPRTNEVVATIHVGRRGVGPHYGNGPLALAAAGKAIWATVPNSGTVVRIDPRTNRVGVKLAVRDQCTLTARGSNVWAAGACGKTMISRIDTATRRVAVTRDVGDVPGPPVVLGRYVWTVTFSGKLARLDARTLRPAGRMPLRGLNVEGESLAAGHGALWVRSEGLVVRLAPR
jgi:DNA-binding beta-propeller fold protein YncE